MKHGSSSFAADGQLLEQLASRCQPIALGSDRILFREGDAPTGVYIVWSGAVLMTSGSNGSTVLSVEAGPGSLLGVPAVVGGKMYSLTAVAMEDAEIGVISCEEFLHLMHTEPGLSFQVLQVLAEEVRFARHVLAHH